MNKNHLVLGSIVLLTALAYYPMLQNQFTYYSDDNYVLHNPLIQNWSWINIKYQFLSFFDGHYHPLTLLSLASTYKIAAANPIAYQVTNLTLHVLNTILVFILAQKLASANTKIPNNPTNNAISSTNNAINPTTIALLTALIFGLHTLHVESVARITERKDMLYALFFLASAIQYVQFGRTQNQTNYWAALLLFLLSLLSKGQAVSLAPSLVLFDWWTGRAWHSPKIVAEKIPFFLLAALFGYLNLVAQQYTGYYLETQPIATYELGAHAAYVLTNYLQKLCFPINLSVHYAYPYALGTPMPPYLWTYSLVVVAISATVYVLRAHKWLLFGALFYLINIVLMLRMIPVADNIMPDRYNYIPLFAYAWIIAQVVNRYYNSPYKHLLTGIVACYVLFLGILTWQRCSVWHNGISVFTDATTHNPTDSQMWQNLGDAYQRANNLTAAETALRKAISFDSTNLLAYISLYNNLSTQQKTDQATALIQQALNTPIRHAQDYGNRAAIRHLLHDETGALTDFNTALQLNPNLAKALYNRGSIYLLLKQPNLALADYQAALAMRPPFVDNIWLMSGKAEAQVGNLGKAKKYFDQTIALNPYYGEAYHLRAWLYYKVQNMAAARSDLLVAKRLGINIDPKLQKAVLGNP